jgi:hypothetical protein
MVTRATGEVNVQNVLEGPRGSSDCILNMPDDCDSGLASLPWARVSSQSVYIVTTHSSMPAHVQVDIALLSCPRADGSSVSLIIGVVPKAHHHAARHSTARHGTARRARSYYVLRVFELR